MKELLIDECNKIKDDNIKLFTEIAIKNLPEYFFIVPASSTGKYHPTYALGEGGLVRHTVAAVRIAYHLFQLEQNQNEFSEHEQDCVISAIILHDGWKQGDGKSKFSTHEHPQVCADWIETSDIFSDIISDEDKRIIANAVSSHMGQWNTSKRSKVILNKPLDKIQKLVHMCDYLASRKDIEIIFDETEVRTEVKTPKLEEFIMPFGKYKGLLLTEIAKTNKDYLQWLKNNTNLQSPLKGFIDELL